MKTYYRYIWLCGSLAALLVANAREIDTKSEHSGSEKKVVASIRPSQGVKAVDLPSLAKITFVEAMKTALAAAPGDILKAEIEIEDGNLMYSFEIVTRQKTIVEVEVDAGNNKILAVDHD